MGRRSAQAKAVKSKLVLKRRWHSTVKFKSEWGTEPTTASQHARRQITTRSLYLMMSLGKHWRIWGNIPSLKNQDTFWVQSAARMSYGGGQRESGKPYVSPCLRVKTVEVWTATRILRGISWNGAGKKMAAVWRTEVNGQNSSEFQDPIKRLSTQCETSFTTAKTLPRAATTMERHPTVKVLRCKGPRQFVDNLYGEESSPKRHWRNWNIARYYPVHYWVHTDRGSEGHSWPRPSLWRRTGKCIAYYQVGYISTMVSLLSKHAMVE